MTLLIDLDGTLANPYKAFSESLFYAFDFFNIARPSELIVRSMIGPPLQESLKELFSFDKTFIEIFIDKYREHHSSIGLDFYELYPGTAEALKLLSNHFILFTATSKPHIMASSILKKNNVSHFFKKIYGAELNGDRSNKAELISYILLQEKLSLDNTIMIGDRKHDIIGAQKNNLQSWGVLWGFGDRGELELAKADKIFDSWNSLYSFAYKACPH